jgi:hypothetical protein
MYEHKNQPLLPPRLFTTRMLKHLAVAAAVITFSLGLGILGYKFFARLSWIDALLNASMILAGEGPVQAMTTGMEKLFASFYALFSGVIFVTASGIVVTPIAHRIIHRIQIEERKDAEKKKLEKAEKGK